MTHFVLYKLLRNLLPLAIIILYLYKENLINDFALFAIVFQSHLTIKTPAAAVSCYWRRVEQARKIAI